MCCTRRLLEVPNVTVQLVLRDIYGKAVIQLETILAAEGHNLTDLRRQGGSRRRNNLGRIEIFGIKAPKKRIFTMLHQEMEKSVQDLQVNRKIKNAKRMGQALLQARRLGFRKPQRGARHQ